MSRFPGIRRRLVLLLRRSHVHRAVDDEIRFHIEMTARELVDQGWSPDEAAVEARRRFGDVDRFRLQSRLIGERMLSRRRRREAFRDRLLDLRFALRVLARRPSFPIVSILTLGLGIGATTAVFSVVHGVLLQPLPYPEPDELVRIQATYPDDRQARGNISEMDFLDFRERNSTLESMAAFNWTGGGVTLNTSDGAVRLVAVRATHDYFDVLRARPLMGRAYTAEEDQPGADTVVVLSHGAWKRYFGSDPRIVGREIRLSGSSVIVVGVMAADFLHAEMSATPPDVWVPLAIDRARNSRGAHYLRSIGRLKAAASVATANAELLAARGGMRIGSRARDLRSLARHEEEGDAVASATTRNAARGRKPLAPFGLRAAPARLLCCPSSPMLQHRLLGDASNPNQRRPQRGPWEFHHGLLGISEALETEYPDSNTGYRAVVEGLHDVAVGAVGRSLWLLFGAVAILLLIALVNVAGLFVARAAGRQRELALRRALGGSRLRLTALLLTESVTLSVLGGLLGIAIAWTMTRFLLALAAGSVPFADNVEMNPAVLLFSVGLMVLTGALFGLAPTLQAADSRLHDALMEAGRGSSAGLARSRLRSRLVVTETALAVVLVVAGGLLIKSFVHLQRVDLGVEPQQVVAARVSLAGPAYRDGVSVAGFYANLLDRLAAHPGVLGAAAVDYVPLAVGHSSDGFRRDDRPEPPPGQGPSAELRRVSEDYFRVMGIRLERGRLLGTADGRDSAPVAVIDTKAARRFWPDEDPLGRSVTFHERSWTIVGVVGAVRHFGPGVEPSPMLYVSHRQEPISWLTVVVRTSLDRAETAAAVRRHVRDLDPSLPVFGVQTLDELAAQSVARPRFQTLLVALFSIAAMLLAATGIYGLTAYTVAQRTQEIGVRVALGAKSTDIRYMVIGGALRLTAVGVVLGLAAYIPVRSLLEGMLYGVSSNDAWVLGAVVTVLFTISAAASYQPSRRASRVDPSDSLRVG